MPSDKNEKNFSRNDTISSGFAHILPLLLVVALVGLGGWWMWKNDKLNIAVEGPSPTPTLSETEVEEVPSDWITYQNNKLRFKFKYPPKLKNSKLVEENEYTKFYEHTTSGPYEYAEFPQLQIYTLEKDSNTSELEWIMQSSNVAVLLNTEQYSEIEWQMIQDWYVSSDHISTFGPELYAYGFFNDTVIQISTTYSRSVLNQILSTFEFIE